MAELLDFTKPHVLRNEAEYTAAVAEIDQLLDLDPPPQLEPYERLEFLSVLVHAYEEAQFPLAQLTTPARRRHLYAGAERSVADGLGPMAGGRKSDAGLFTGDRQFVTPTNCVPSSTLGYPSGSPPQPWRST